MTIEECKKIRVGSVLGNGRGVKVYLVVAVGRSGVLCLTSYATTNFGFTTFMTYEDLQEQYTYYYFKVMVE